MIRVNEKYGIVPSATDYAVVKIRTTDKSGEIKYDKDGNVIETNTPLSYHDSIVMALRKVAKFTARDAVRDGDMTLSEAVTRIQTALDKLTEEIENAVPDVKVVKR